MNRIQIATTVLSRQFDALQKAAEQGHDAAHALATSLPAVMLWGPPGIGKSTLVRAIAEERGVGFIDVRLAQREPVDMRGLPVPDGDGVRWLVSSEWPRDPDSRGIILFDELSSADRTLQVAAYEFILDRRLGDLYTLPPGWLVVGAGNRSQDRAVAQGMSSALANRFLHIELQADASSWLRWARQAGIDRVVVDHIAANPDQLFVMDAGDCERGWASPRSWERLATMRPLVSDLSEDARVEIYGGLVGMAAARAFLLTEANADDAGPDLVAVLRGDAPWEVPTAADEVRTQLAAMVRLLSGAEQPEASLEVFIDAVLRAPVVPASAAIVELMQHAPILALSLHNVSRFDELVDRHGMILSGKSAASQEARP